MIKFSIEEDDVKRILDFNSLIIRFLYLVSGRKHHCKWTLKHCKKCRIGRKDTLYLISATMKMTFTLGHDPISDTLMEFSRLMPCTMKHNTNRWADSLIVPNSCMHYIDRMIFGNMLPNVVFMPKMWNLQPKINFSSPIECRLVPSWNVTRSTLKRGSKVMVLGQWG